MPAKYPKQIQRAKIMLCSRENNGNASLKSMASCVAVVTVEAIARVLKAEGL
jgi:hypothetical protein